MKKAYGITMGNEDFEIIPPAPSEDRGGITKTEYDKFNNASGVTEDRVLELINTQLGVVENGTY